LQHPLFLDALQATLQKIDLKDLLPDLPFQFRNPAFRPALFPIAGEDVARPCAEFPPSPMPHIRVYFQPACYLGDRYPLLQPPDGGQLKLLRELPARQSHDSILHSLKNES
jgi:hypothetical protein